ncbi:MAG TPA: hypothetical protein VES38_06775 [Methylotenera sp.]|nr:hypothetical protein [Methylotenera sp.]
MPIAVVILLSDEGQMMVGEVDASTISTEEFQPVQTFEEAVEVAQSLTLGEEPPPEIEENAFNQSLNSPTKDPMQEMEG